MMELARADSCTILLFHAHKNSVKKFGARNGFSRPGNETGNSGSIMPNLWSLGWNCAVLKTQRRRQMRQHLLGTDLHEVRLFDLPVLQQIGGLSAAGLCGVTLDQALQFGLPVIHRDRAGHQSFHVHQVPRRPIRIVQIGHAASHTGPEIRADFAQDHGDPASHVFAAVRPAALDDDMRARLADLNPTASSRMANRLLEAHDRNYWQPDEDTLAALQDAADTLEDRLEGIAAE